MLTAVTQTGASISGNLLAVLSSPWLGAEVEPPESDLNPIAPEMKEIIWGFGPYVVFALLLIFVLFPKLKKGMDARYEGIRSDHEQADAMRAAARAEVAEYEGQLASVKAEAATRVDAARQQLEVKRQERLATLNARLAEERAAAVAANDEARAAVRGQIQSAVADVAGRAGELATGRAPSPDVVNRVVSEVMAR